MIFIANCPNGHATVQNRDVTELSRHVGTGQLPLMCSRCGEQWFADQQMLDGLQQRIRMERYRMAPRPDSEMAPTC